MYSKPIIHVTALTTVCESLKIGQYYILSMYILFIGGCTTITHKQNALTSLIDLMVSLDNWRDELIYSNAYEFLWYRAYRIMTFGVSRPKHLHWYWTALSHAVYGISLAYQHATSFLLIIHWYLILLDSAIAAGNNMSSLLYA